MAETATATSPENSTTKEAPVGVKSAKSDNNILRMAVVTERRTNGLKIEKSETTDGVKSNGESKETSSVKKDEVKSETTPKAEVPEVKPSPSQTEPPKAETIDYWKEESRKHQSRADKFETESKKSETDKDKEIATLKSEVGKYKPLVENFEKNPLEVIQNYLPQIQEQLALQNGNGIGFVEQAVAKVKTQVDTEFTKQYGENWRYSEVESFTPGTASFKYKEALEGARINARNSFVEYVGKQKQAIADQQKQIVADKERLRTEYGFTDEDFKAVDEFTQKNNWSYYLIARVARADEILRRQLEKAKILAPHTPPNSISSSPSSTSDAVTKQVISKQGATMASRLGLRNF